jgi:hypothetical protein
MAVSPLRKLGIWRAMPLAFVFILTGVSLAAAALSLAYALAHS